MTELEKLKKQHEDEVKKLDAAQFFITYLYGSLAILKFIDSASKLKIKTTIPDFKDKVFQAVDEINELCDEWSKKMK